jgi:hypothetical protein
VFSTWRSPTSRASICTSLPDCGATVNDASRTQLPSSMSLSRQRSHTPGSWCTPAQLSAVVNFCLPIEYKFAIYSNDRLIRHRRLKDLREEQLRISSAPTPVDLKVRGEILDDLSAINKVVEERLASYTCAHALATAKTTTVRATWALQERPMALLTTATETPLDDQHSSTAYLDRINSPCPA